jgi:6-phosphogluconolactonase
MQIDPATGVLSLVGNVPLTELPDAIAVHPNQKFIYLATSELTSSISFGTAYRGEISVFTLSEKEEKSHSCALTLTSQLSVSDFANSIAAEPMGQYAYTANRTSATVGEYSIDSTTGALSTIGTVNTENPANPMSAPIWAATRRTRLVQRGRGFQNRCEMPSPGVRFASRIGR